MTDINWITLRKLADETDYSEKALREQIARGNFAYGYAISKHLTGEFI